MPSSSSGMFVDADPQPMLPCNASLPSFQYRIRIVSVSAGPNPTGPSQWMVALDPERSGVTTFNLGNWSAVGNFTTAHAAAKATEYPNAHGRLGYLDALVIKFVMENGGPNQAQGVAWGVEVELTPCGAAELPITLKGNLYSGNKNGWAELVILLSTNRTTMPAFAMTGAQFNTQRYWKPLFDQISVATPPRKFPIGDRFTSGDTDTLNLAAGLAAMRRLGFTFLEGGTDAGAHKIFETSSGLTRTGGDTYNPAGGMADSGVTPGAMAAWAGQQMAPFLGSGFIPQDIAVYGIGDEPAFYW